MIIEEKQEIRMFLMIGLDVQAKNEMTLTKYMERHKNMPLNRF